MSEPRNNHYVPQMYQKRFSNKNSGKLWRLHLNPNKKTLPDGKTITMNSCGLYSPKQCFFEKDLYTTFFGQHLNSDIETNLFGKIDSLGAQAIEAFTNNDSEKWHTHFENFFTYLDAQKIRTPKGLDWLKSHYPKLTQVKLMIEMQAIRARHCTIWGQGVREIISAKNSSIKFIISDHPVTVYNYACTPDSPNCKYPNEPPITFKGSQTIFPLNMEYCLILTNYEYAENPNTENPIENRTFARYYNDSLMRTDTFIKSRELNEEEVLKINFIMKTRSHRYVAGAEKSWLYPEKSINTSWSELRNILLPPKNELWQFGGEMYIGYKNGDTQYQDMFGRSTPQNKHLKKPKRKNPIRQNEDCCCGSGKKFKNCCMNRNESERTTWNEYSIRERNIIFFNAIINILGLDDGKTWDDVRRKLNGTQIKEIHEVYGSLWPTDTDLMNLLPKPNKGYLRAVYTGIIDPRIFDTVIGLTLYFDEIIIQSPFVNPNVTKPDFNPTIKPDQFIKESLKNILLFMQLMPFIEKGYINFIPDPCDFDFHLRTQKHTMAKERTQKQPFNNKDKIVMKFLNKNDFEHIFSSFSTPKKTQELKKIFPNFSHKEIENTLNDIELKLQQDSLAPLQKNIFNKAGGQLILFNMNPNFEISLFLCQITGSIFLTDSDTRWEEIEHSLKQKNGKIISDWDDLTDYMNEIEYILNSNPETVFNLRQSGMLREFRKAMRELYSFIQDKKEPDEIKYPIKRFKKEFIEIQKTTKKETLGKLKQNTNFKFSYSIPKDGIANTNVQRLLLLHNNGGYLENVPMAIFVESP